MEHRRFDPTRHRQFEKESPPGWLFTTFFVVAMILAVVITLAILAGGTYVLVKVVN